MIFDFREFNERDLHDVMLKIKVKKSVVYDCIYGYFLETTFPYASRVIKLIFSEFTEINIFSVSSKIA